VFQFICPQLVRAYWQTTLSVLHVCVLHAPAFPTAHMHDMVEATSYCFQEDRSRPHCQRSMPAAVPYALQLTHRPVLRKCHLRDDASYAVIVCALRATLHASRVVARARYSHPKACPPEGVPAWHVAFPHGHLVFVRGRESLPRSVCSVCPTIGTLSLTHAQMGVLEVCEPSLSRCSSLAHYDFCNV
jgi:hypothetical protein